MNFDKAFAFLKKLSRNNNREWFEKNKPSYLEIKNEFENIIFKNNEEIKVIENEKSKVKEEMKEIKIKGIV